MRLLSRFICSNCGALLAHRSSKLLFSSSISCSSRARTSQIESSEVWQHRSGVVLKEMEVKDSLQVEDEQMAREKEFAELKRALGMNAHSYNAEQLLLIHPRIRGGRRGGGAPGNSSSPELEVEEAQALCQTIPGFRVASTVVVNTDGNVRKKLVWKRGRLEAILEHKQRHNVTAIMLDVDILSPLQQRELSAFFGVPIFDRYNIVLNIFKLYARTREAKLQIALAEIPYIRERLKFLHQRPDTPSDSLHISSALSSIRNSDDCKKLEILRLREHGIRKQIRLAMDSTRQRVLELKGHGGPAKTPVVGVIGYTNAGKTSLIKRLTDSKALFGENRLFATLDTSTHRGVLPSSNKVILADTIGFISNLPVKLFASFSATLQHVESADFLIHVMDLSHPNLPAQRENVLGTLAGLNIRKELVDGMLEVGNKLDKCGQGRRRELAGLGFLPAEGGGGPSQGRCCLLPISCRTTQGIPELIRRLDKSVQLFNGSRVRRLRLALASRAIPYLYEEEFVCTAPTPSECGEQLLFDVVMNEDQFAKFQSAIGTRFKRKEGGGGEGQEDQAL